MSDSTPPPFSGYKPQPEFLVLTKQHRTLDGEQVFTYTIDSLPNRFFGWYDDAKLALGKDGFEYHPPTTQKLRDEHGRECRCEAYVRWPS